MRLGNSCTWSQEMLLKKEMRFLGRPPPHILKRLMIIVPEDLQRFLHNLICGQNTVQPSEGTYRLESSIGQDICRAATRARWKLPKHILVCMTLRHLFRSAKLSTLINKLGHAESYSFSLELETTLATALDDASGILTT